MINSTIDNLQSAAPSRSGRRTTYDRDAARYDRERYEAFEGRFFHELETTVLRNWLGPRPGLKILDVPAGTGRLSVELAKAGVTVIGADISAPMLHVAVSKRESNSDGHAYFLQGSGSQLPFADNTFDAVISFKFFHLIPNESKRAFIQDMARVLKPGCPLVVEFNSPYYGGVLALLRYYLRKKQPGGMRMKCIFPDQIPPLFEGLEVKRTLGVKLPFSGTLAALLGRERAASWNLAFGRMWGAKYFAYAIIVEARKQA